MLHLLLIDLGGFSFQNNEIMGALLNRRIYFGA
jgi:hypothetical protein